MLIKMLIIGLQWYQYADYRNCFAINFLIMFRSFEFSFVKIVVSCGRYDMRKLLYMNNNCFFAKYFI